ncbi:MAG: lipopolysaccharide kinase InaA family protein [bacterium]|nr:lipopolysaccharide kinase InaA family protein [bacterium]
MKQAEEFFTSTYKDYIFGFSKKLTEIQCNEILKVIESPVTGNTVGLEGRRSIQKLFLSEIGSVVVKNYRRGGFASKFIGSRYLRWGSTRSQVEYQSLKLVRSLGINAPEPVTFVQTKGDIFYSAWLVTKEIVGSRSLASLSKTDEVTARNITAKAAMMIVELIQNGVVHVDLHPGNVLLGEDQKVYLIDFDKAYITNGSRKELRDFYLCRWRRACIKHELSEYLCEIMSLALRQHEAWDPNCKVVR